MTKRLTHLHIETGPEGWLKAFWRREGGQENVAFVQFRPPKTKRQGWAIVGIKASKHSEPNWLSTALVDDVPRHRIEQAVAASEVFRSGLLAKIDEKAPGDLDTAFRRIYREAPRITLERPPRNKRDADFYRRVALAYRQAVAAGLPPLKTMAADSGIPEGTIARWVAEARERQHLPAGEKGKVTAHAG
jgi:hypothetical protein